MSEQKIHITGHLELRAIYPDGESEVLHSETNQVTDLYLDVLVELLGQRSTFLAPDVNQVHSMWYETSAADIPDPTRADVTFAPGVNIPAQEIIADADRDSILVGTAHALQVRTTLGAGVGLGETIRAVGLYTRGTSNTPPSPVGFVSGVQDVRLIARQKTPPIPKGNFQVESTWTLLFQIV